MDHFPCPYRSKLTDCAKSFIEQAMTLADRNFLFLDRDGVINDDINTYVLNLNMFHLKNKVVQAITKASQMRWIINICTNQPGISKGVMTHQDLEIIHSYLRSIIEENGGIIGEFVYCIHSREYPCPCRKPKAGMLFSLAEEFKMNEDEIKRAWFVGDHERDYLASQSFGCRYAHISDSPVSFDINQNFPIFKSLYEFVNIQL